MNKQRFRFILFVLMCLSVILTAAAQVEISVVPSANNPAVGHQIEVSINIAGGSNVAGYEFRLTFDSTELEFISIENSNYLTGELFVQPIEPEDGSVKFVVAALTGTGEGNGPLAIAKFKVLAEIETTIGLEDVKIFDRAAQPIALTSVTGTTITPTIEYLLSIPAGMSLIHVPLKVTAVDDVAKTIGSVADLYGILGGEGNVIYLVTRDSQTQEWISYLSPSDRGTPKNRELTDDMGIIANLITPVPLHLSGSPLGTNGSSTIRLNPGINLVGVPLRDPGITHVSDLFALEGIADNVRAVMLIDNGKPKQIQRASDASAIPITGGQSFIITALEAATVVISGEGWANDSGTAAAPPVIMRGIEVDDVTPILALRGSIVDQGTGLNKPNFRVTVKNLSTGRAAATVTPPDEMEYRFIVVDMEVGRAAQIGDILEISAQSPDPFVGVEPLRYTVTAEDMKQSLIQLPNLIAYEIPAETELLSNYPNPFNPETWIPYQLAHAADVTLTIYDTSGALVRQLDLGYQQAGYYTNRTRAAYWDGRNHLGEMVGSGVYFCQLHTGDYSTTRKMVTLK